jgi:hypothetical protein
VVSKVRGTHPVFAHATFVVHPGDSGAGPGFGHVEWEDLSIRVHWHTHGERVAALGWDGHAEHEAVEWGWAGLDQVDPAPGTPLERLVERLSERERRSVHSRGSALVRLSARAALAAALGVEETRVEVVCGEGPKGRMPPEVFLDGALAPADVSLSHHGRWLAWAVRRSAPVDGAPMKAEPAPDAEP